MLTSTVEQNRRQFACEGEMVTFTCQVNGSLVLQWHGPLISQDPIVFSIDPAAPVVVSRSSFIATLTSITRSGSNSNFTSTLQVNTSRRFARSDTTVECRNQLGVNGSLRFTVAGITMLNIFSQMHSFYHILVAFDCRISLVLKLCTQDITTACVLLLT